MIVDTSALIAVANEERGFRQISDAILEGGAVIPAPVLVEFQRVVTVRGSRLNPRAEAVLRFFLDEGLEIEPFIGEDASYAAEANTRFGCGNGRGGTLNLLDLMVYAMARRLDRPILCTGRDFGATDAGIHAASRA